MLEDRKLHGEGRAETLLEEKVPVFESDVKGISVSEFEQYHVLLLFRYGDLHTGKCCFTPLEENTKASSVPFEEHEDEDIQSGMTGSDASPL